MSSLYNRSDLSPYTRANAEQVNAELAKVQAAIDALQQNIADIIAGTPIASYTWTAYSNSGDGTADFTTGEPGDRLYIGLAYNRGTPTESTDPSDYAWTRFRGQDGADAGSGSDGLSIVEKYVYKRAASAPATPTGGSFNFSTQATTAPSGWSTGVPSGTDPVWVSVAVASKQGIGGTASFGTWSAPALAFASGADGSDGTDGAPGSSVDVIFRRSAAQPSTPSAGMSTPAGWYTNVAAVPGSSDPLFSSFGTRPNPATNWTWNTPVLVEGQDGLSGIDGIDGDDGKLVEFVWKRAASIPATPTGNGIPATWSDDPPAGSDPLWMSKAKQNLDGTLVSGETWSSPVRHDGPPGDEGTSSWTPVMGGGVTRSGSAYSFNTTYSNPNYDGFVYSAEKGAGATLSFTVDQATALIVASLNTDPESTTGYTGQDYMLYFSGNVSGLGGQSVLAHISGADQGEVIGYSPGDRFALRHVGSEIQCFKNNSSTPFYTFTGVSPTARLALDIRGRQAGKSLSNVTLSFSGTNGSDGSDGNDGAAGNKTVRVYRRSGSPPSTPTGNVPPSGWTAGAIPADDGNAVWASDVETLANGVTVVGSYTTPVLFQAATPVAGNTTIVLDDGSYGSPAITRFIPNGGSIPISARIRTLLAAGSGTQYMRIEWRVKGGTYATLGSEGSGDYIPGEFAVVSQFETFTNSSGADQNYEFRAFTRYTGSYAGVEESRSHITA